MTRLHIFVLTLIVSILPTSSVIANTERFSSAQYENQDRFVRQMMREHIGYDPLLEIIAGCESTGNPYRIEHWDEDGNLIKNPRSSAGGALQVLLQYHSDWIAQEGREMQNIDEYMMFVSTMYEERGYRSWDESRGCWGPYSHLGIL